MNTIRFDPKKITPEMEQAALAYIPIKQASKEAFEALYDAAGSYDQAIHVLRVVEEELAKGNSYEFQEKE